MKQAKVRFFKGHGALNDFIVLLDPDCEFNLSADDVVRLCDRRTGLGADGVLRAVHCSAFLEGTAAGSAEWFMDYRNADGTLGAMCGNGLRVFASALAAAGLSPRGRQTFGTRAGARTVYIPWPQEGDGGIIVEMGSPSFPGPDGIEVTHGHLRLPALHVDMGNPHAVAFVDDLSEVADLRDAPKVTPSWAYPDGVTVELVTVRAPHHLALRVHERGVGETPACGTGACAASAAWRHHQQHTGPGTYIVDVPGGRLLVTAHADGSMQLTGPTEIVADGVILLGGPGSPRDSQVVAPGGDQRTPTLAGRLLTL